MDLENYIYYPERLSGEELDIFLEMGWYRMGQSIFTTHFILLDAYIYRVFWLRYDLRRLVLSNWQRRLKKRNERFRVSIKPVEITDELEELYRIYKTDIDFRPASSVYAWLHENRNYNVFNTELIEIRDQGKLIAAGITDWGVASIAGIMNFYHPDYKRFSLGKYLMLLKIEQARQKGLRWYYPGYLVFQRPGFDYKLSIDRNAIEVLIPEMDGWQMFDPKLIDKYGISLNPEKISTFIGAEESGFAG